MTLVHTCLQTLAYRVLLQFPIASLVQTVPTAHIAKLDITWISLPAPFAVSTTVFNAPPQLIVRNALLIQSL